MNSLFSSKKGSAFVWLGILFVAVAFALFFLVLNEPWEDIKGVFGANFTGTSEDDITYATTYQKMNTVWNYLPAIALISFVIFGVVSVLRRPD